MCSEDQEQAMRHNILMTRLVNEEGAVLAAARNVNMYALPSHSMVPGPNAASSLADRVPTTDVSTKLQEQLSCSTSIA